MFREEFRKQLALGKYTKWASELTEDELAAVLWAVGEYGFRAPPVLECLDRHADEFLPGHGFPRARLALDLVHQMVQSKRYSLDDVIAQVQVVLAQGRAERESRESEE